MDKKNLETLRVIKIDMRLYICVTPFFPSPGNFRGVFVYDQVKAIARTGMYDKVLVFKPISLNQKETQYRYNDIDVYYFHALQMPSYVFNGITNGINSYLFRKRIKQLGISVDDVSVVHGHTSSFASYGVSLKTCNPSIKAIVQHHDPDPFTIRNGVFSSNVINLWVRATINRKLFEEVDLHVSVSKYVAQNLLSFPKASVNECFPSYLSKLRVAQKMGLKPFRPKNSFVLYNGVDTSEFYPKRNKSDSKSFIIGCIANFLDWKDQITLIKAARQLVLDDNLPELRVVLIGSGPYLEECKSYVSQNNLDKYVVFQSEVEHPLLLDFYNSLDLFVLPSYFEGFGCVFTEAYACGVPFMGCYHQGYSEYIPEEEQDKWLIEPGDYAQLAKNIEAYIKFGYHQRLNHTYDINVLIKNFLTYLETL